MARYSEELHRVGAHFVVGLKGATLTPLEQELLSELRPAGVILFANNVDKTDEKIWAKKIITLLAAAQDSSSRENFITSIDHEGGRVHRFPLPVTKFPAAKRWHERGQVEAVAIAMARELRALGFNLSFAPVLDVHTRPENPVIGDRAFATTPQEVARSAELFLRALENEGVRGCGKHFPGHGDTSTDSHYELPVVDRSLKQLEECELIPFRHLVQCGVKAMMTAHVMFPQIDRTLPATLSPAILDGILRATLGFRGVIFSDALDMRALEKLHSTPLGPALLNAGGDILLVAKALPGRNESALPLEHASEMALELLRGVDRGTVPEKRVERSAERVKEFLAQLPPRSGGDLAVLGSAEHQALASQLA